MQIFFSLLRLAEGVHDALDARVEHLIGWPTGISVLISPLLLASKISSEL
jgi:hypothetical protein